MSDEPSKQIEITDEQRIKFSKIVSELGTEQHKFIMEEIRRIKEEAPEFATTAVLFAWFAGFFSNFLFQYVPKENRKTAIEQFCNEVEFIMSQFELPVVEVANESSDI